MAAKKEGGHLTCVWHLQGVPAAFQGKPFFVEGCPMCEAKAAKNPELRKAPAPDVLVKQRREHFKATKRLVDWDRVNAGKLKQFQTFIRAEREI